MYFITKEEDLIGKEIAFTHMAQFARAITIVTKDKGILVVEQYQSEEFNGGIKIYPAQRSKSYVFNDRYLRKELHKKGIITEKEIEAYEEKIRIEQEKMKEDRIKRREEQERKDYERLKEKFENQ